jgi:hypothetical protein
VVSRPAPRPACLPKRPTSPRRNRVHPSADNALVHEDTLPVGWQRLGAAPHPGELHRLNASALHVLQAALAWDELPAPDTEEEAGVRTQELLRLETKLNLVLELLSELVQQQGLMPNPVPVRLSAEGIGFETHDRLAPGEHLRLGIYLVAGTPKALTLPAVVKAVERRGDAYWVQARFVDLTAAVRDLLERLLFRFHRRRVAQARRAHQPDPT